MMMSEQQALPLCTTAEITSAFSDILCCCCGAIEGAGLSYLDKINSVIQFMAQNKMQVKLADVFSLK